jgi:ADP-ribose pyrophosphatase YjhB (NUDIX family)
MLISNMENIHYNSEEEFLKAYDSSIFEKLSMTVDTLIFSVSSTIQRNYRKLPEKNFSVLLVKRDTYPFKNKWCLPGGFIDMKENLDEAAKRVLKNETNLSDVYLEQLYTFGDIDRDPRMRIVSISYMSLVDKNMLDDNIYPSASWFNVFVREKEGKMSVKLDNGSEMLEFVVEKSLLNRTSNNYKYSLISDTSLAFDHSLVIARGIDRLKSKIEYTDVVFNMMPKKFTLGELQQVYEVILGEKMLAPAFRRIIKDRVRDTGKYRVGGGHRPSKLYSYRGKV